MLKYSNIQAAQELFEEIKNNEQEIRTIFFIIDSLSDTYWDSDVRLELADYIRENYPKYSEQAADIATIFFWNLKFDTEIIINSVNLNIPPVEIVDD